MTLSRDPSRESVRRKLGNDPLLQSYPRLLENGGERRIIDFELYARSRYPFRHSRRVFFQIARYIGLQREIGRRTFTARDMVGHLVDVYNGSNYVPSKSGTAAILARFHNTLGIERDGEGAWRIGPCPCNKHTVFPAQTSV